MVQDILAQDLAEGQYFVTGNLTPEVFADDCRQISLCRIYAVAHMQVYLV